MTICYNGIECEVIYHEGLGVKYVGRILIQFMAYINTVYSVYVIFDNLYTIMTSYSEHYYYETEMKQESLFN